MSNLTFLDNIGTDKAGSKPINNVVTRAIKGTIRDAQRTLDKKGKVSSGDSSDIIFTVTKEADGQTITIGYAKNNPAKKYYSYLDKGVNGTDVNNGAPFSYKHNVPSRAMLQSLQKWVKRSKAVSKKEDQRKKLSSNQKKNKKVSQFGDVYGLAVSITKKGMKPTHYMTAAIEKNFGDKFKRDYAESFKQAIKIEIKDGYNNK